MARDRLLSRRPLSEDRPLPSTDGDVDGNEIPGPADDVEADAANAADLRVYASVMVPEEADAWASGGDGVGEPESLAAVPLCSRGVMDPFQVNKIRALPQGREGGYACKPPADSGAKGT
jgi:hypothetical protein